MITAVRSVSPAGECYLRPNRYANVVNTGGYIEILPLNPAYLYVPVYSGSGFCSASTWDRGGSLHPLRPQHFYRTCVRAFWLV
jgi:hypothetical protein